MITSMCITQVQLDDTIITPEAKYKIIRKPIVKKYPGDRALAILIIQKEDGTIGEINGSSNWWVDVDRPSRVAV